MELGSESAGPIVCTRDASELQCKKEVQIGRSGVGEFPQPECLIGGSLIGVLDRGSIGRAILDFLGDSFCGVVEERQYER